jgi:hypothetical protein
LKRLVQDDKLTRFRYIYATDADHQLWISNLPQLLESISLNPSTVLVPHRLNAVPALMQEFVNNGGSDAYNFAINSGNYSEEQLSTHASMMINRVPRAERWEQHVVHPISPTSASLSCCQSGAIELADVTCVNRPPHYDQCLPANRSEDFSLMKIGSLGFPVATFTALPVGANASVHTSVYMHKRFVLGTCTPSTHRACPELPATLMQWRKHLWGQATTTTIYPANPLDSADRYKARQGKV